MARLNTCGFEWNDATADGYTVSATPPTVVSSPLRSGSFALQASSPGAARTATFGLTAITAVNYFARAYFRFSAAPDTNPRLVGYSVRLV